MLKSSVRALAAVALLALPITTAAAAKEEIKLTLATGHPTVFLWVKHIQETFIPTVNAELAKYDEVEIKWTEGYGGTIVKLGSEADAFEQGIMDVGQMMGIFNPSTLGLLNLTYAMPFGSIDARTVTTAVEAALNATDGAIAGIEEATGIVYIGGGISIDNYGIGATKAMTSLSDMEGVKIAGAGPNLAWLRSTGAVGVQGSYVTFYNDMKTGVYDAHIGWHTASVPSKMYEVAPHWNQVDFGAMYIGGLGVSKARWDTFSDNTKSAFRVAATAYTKAFLEEQDARFEAALITFKENGGEIHVMDASERSKWISAMPNPSNAWIEGAEARDEPARELLKNYKEILAKAGFTFERDYLSE